MYTSTELIHLSSYKLMLALAASQLIQVILHFVTGVFTIARTSGPQFLNKVKKLIKFFV